jgi:hypothetical protein
VDAPVAFEHEQVAIARDDEIDASGERTGDYGFVVGIVADGAAKRGAERPGRTLVFGGQP